MNIIKLGEYTKKTCYACDEYGIVIEYNSRILRIIKREKSEEVLELFRCGLMDDIVNQGLFVESFLQQSVVIEGFEENIIVEHKMLNHISYAEEWTPSMLEDAAKLIVKLNSCLLSYGYELADPHVGQIIFEGCKPRYVDLGSIQKQEHIRTNGWFFFKDNWSLLFKLFDKIGIDFLYAFGPSLFHNGRVSRQTLLEIMYGEKLGKAISKIQDTFRKTWDYLIFRPESSKKVVLTLSRLFKTAFRINNERIREIKIQKYNKTECEINTHVFSNDRWSNYQEGQDFYNERYGWYVNKIANIVSIENDLSVLDIAGNSGGLSEAIARSTNANHVWCIDYDYGAIEKGYRRLREEALPISFSVVDFLLCRQLERYKSDIVIALALCHHLLLSQKIHMDVLIDKLASVTKRYLFVEFMPLGLWSNDNDENTRLPDWYNIDCFIDCLRVHFEIDSIKELSKNRICIVCKKRLNLSL